MASGAAAPDAFNERSYILDRRQTFSEDRAGSIDSNEGAFDDMKQLIDEDGDENKSSLPLASFNFINSIIGSGVIGIPYALHEAGFGFGLLLLVLVAYVTDYSLVLMVKSGHLCGRFSYQAIMHAAFGRPGYLLLTLMQFFYPFIAMVSYNVVVGDTVTKVLVRVTGMEETSLFARREVVVLVATLFITVPLCLYRDIARLAKISFLSLVCIGFILFSIFLEIGSMSARVPHHEQSWSFVNKDIIPAIGIMAFAFMCHHNTFLIYGSMHNASLQSWKTVTHISVCTSLLVCCLFGIAGYATFKAFSQGDLLENYCWDDDLMNVSRLLFSVQILLTYPIECFVAREVLESAIFGGGGCGGEDAPVGPDPVAQTAGAGAGHEAGRAPVSERTHYLLTLAVVGATYLISMATDCLGVVLELNGVLAAVPLAYILPAASYLQLEEGPLLSREKATALAVGLFGVVVAALGVAFLIADFRDVNTCSHGRSMAYCNATALMQTFDRALPAAAAAVGVAPSSASPGAAHARPPLPHHHAAAAAAAANLSSAVAHHHQHLLRAVLF